MSVLVFAENWEGKFKKPAQEALTYGYELAQKTGGTLCAVVIGHNIQGDEINKLGAYGCPKVLSAIAPAFASFSANIYATVIADAAKKENATHIVFSHTYTGKSVAPRVAVKLQAGLAAGAVSLPSSPEPFIVRKKCFSGKGFTDVQISSPVKIVSLSPNSHHVFAAGEHKAADFKIEEFNPALPAADTTVNEVKKTSGKVVLTEAEIVVSGGRGLKGPENWGMVEALADALGAATACSKPVADMGWRPHHEHVGQTGITIAPNLYIAIGISGAIQHLAGVSSSKVMVAINTDKEAPFFQAADYGIIGDAFDVVPKLTEAIKQLKSAH